MEILGSGIGTGVVPDTMGSGIGTGIVPDTTSSVTPHEQRPRLQSYVRSVTLHPHGYLFVLPSEVTVGWGSSIFSSGHTYPRQFIVGTRRTPSSSSFLRRVRDWESELRRFPGHDGLRVLGLRETTERRRRIKMGYKVLLRRVCQC